jgi:hypothetical protein
MSAWTVVPCLVCLRDEFNELAPGRDKGADGTIGDTSHSSSSDHTPDEDSTALRGKDADSNNEVHGLDIDSSGPWPAEGHPERTHKQRFDAKVKKVIAGEKAKWLNPNDRCRLNYVIWDGQIYDNDNEFEPRKYTATPDPHTNHAHFSARYETACENDTRPWGVIEEDDGMATISQADFNTRMDAWWTARMEADSTPHAALLQLRRAPWNQVVNAQTGETMYQVIYRAAQAAAVLPLVQSLSEAFAAYVASEGVEDAETELALANLQVAVNEANAALAELTAEPPTQG